MYRLMCSLLPPGFRSVSKNVWHIPTPIRFRPRPPNRGPSRPVRTARRRSPIAHSVSSRSAAPGQRLIARALPAPSTSVSGFTSVSRSRGMLRLRSGPHCRPSTRTGFSQFDSSKPANVQSPESRLASMRSGMLLGAMPLGLKRFFVLPPQVASVEKRVCRPWRVRNVEQCGQPGHVPRHPSIDLRTVVFHHAVMIVMHDNRQGILALAQASEAMSTIL